MRILAALLLIISTSASAQLKWTNVDSLFGPLPASVHVYYTNDSIDGKPNIAYYVIADLKDKTIDFTTDTSKGRRLTPSQFYKKNDNALVVVNCTFFSFETNRNLNLVMKNRRLLSYNQHSITLRGKDTFKYAHTYLSAIGISKDRKADVAWTFTDTFNRNIYATQWAMPAVISTTQNFSRDTALYNASYFTPGSNRPVSTLKKWKMQTAVGGGPVLLQNGEIKISNDEERKFAGKAINDKHPRTAMGYTKDNKLIILVVQGRFPGVAEGATLPQEAQMLKDLGCSEALNLDGGGSSCMLVNGKETIKPSDKAGEQRAVPAVFLIRTDR
jgi:exopolysaccharide biosynthesis protein